MFHVTKSPGRAVPQAHLVDRRICEDGHRESDRAAGIYYASTSRRLVDDLSRLLLRFGISTRTRITRKVGYRNGYTIDISGSDDQRRFLQRDRCPRRPGCVGGRFAARHRPREDPANTNVDTVPVQVWDDVKDLLTDRGMTHRQFQAAMGDSVLRFVDRTGPPRPGSG